MERTCDIIRKVVQDKLKGRLGSVDLSIKAC